MDDKCYLEMCIKLAEENKNDELAISVAAMIVDCSGKIVSTGFSRILNGKMIHAELDAINRAGYIGEESTLYTTLEPCIAVPKKKGVYSNKKKVMDYRGTYLAKHSCVDHISSNLIERVVIGAIDPNPWINGRGFRALCSKGIDVRVIDDFKDRIISLNPGYFNRK